MDGEKEWERFTSSGKVEDYLEYKGCIDHAVQGTNVVPSGPEAASGALLMDTERKKDNTGKVE